MALLNELDVALNKGGQVGHAIIHSKVLVIDPFSKDPVVITGSHNFSGAASTNGLQDDDK